MVPESRMLSGMIGVWLVVGGWWLVLGFVVIGLKLIVVVQQGVIYDVVELFCIFQLCRPFVSNSGVVWGSLSCLVLLLCVCVFVDESVWCFRAMSVVIWMCGYLSGYMDVVLLLCVVVVVSMLPSICIFYRK